MLDDALSIAMGHTESALALNVNAPLVQYGPYHSMCTENFGPYCIEVALTFGSKAFSVFPMAIESAWAIIALSVRKQSFVMIMMIVYKQFSKHLTKTGSKLQIDDQSVRCLKTYRNV